MDIEELKKEIELKKKKLIKKEKTDREKIEANQEKLVNCLNINKENNIKEEIPLFNNDDLNMLNNSISQKYKNNYVYSIEKKEDYSDKNIIIQKNDFKYKLLKQIELKFSKNQKHLSFFNCNSNNDSFIKNCQKNNKSKLKIEDKKNDNNSKKDRIKEKIKNIYNILNSNESQTNEIKITKKNEMKYYNPILNRSKSQLIKQFKKIDIYKNLYQKKSNISLIKNVNPHYNLYDSIKDIKQLDKSVSYQRIEHMKKIINKKKETNEIFLKKYIDKISKGKDLDEQINEWLNENNNNNNNIYKNLFSNNSRDTRINNRLVDLKHFKIFPEYNKRKIDEKLQQKYINNNMTLLSKIKKEIIGKKNINNKDENLLLIKNKNYYNKINLNHNINIDDEININELLFN